MNNNPHWLLYGCIYRASSNIEVAQFKDNVPLLVMRDESSAEEKFVVLHSNEPFAFEPWSAWTLPNLLQEFESKCKTQVDELHKRFPCRHFCWLKGAKLITLHTVATADLQNDKRPLAEASFHNGKAIMASPRMVCEFAWSTKDGLSDQQISGSAMLVDHVLHELDHGLYEFEPICPGIDQCLFVAQHLLNKAPDEWPDNLRNESSLLTDDSELCDGSGCQFSIKGRRGN